MDNSKLKINLDLDLEEKYIATIVLHAVGDTIGFKNGDWEFNYHKLINTLDTTLEILYEFIDLGGINNINLKDWFVSDDTMFHMATALSLIDIPDPGEKLYEDMKNNFKGAYSHMSIDQRIRKFRFIGVVTNKYIKKFDTTDARSLPYDPESGGAGCAMRTACIGLAFPTDANREKLIEVAIQSSRITHNSPIGYLGGLCTALFTAFAIEGLHIYTWPTKMLDILDLDIVKKYITDEDEQNDYDEFIKYWRKYIDIRFDEGVPIKTKAQRNLIFRSRFYYENFTRGTRGLMIGDSGFSSVIMAYDCLLDAKDNWETLIIYSAIHWGDSDTVGSIACALYGAQYGFKNVPDGNLKHLEFKTELYEIGKNLFKTFKIL
jgi:ADP-ribosylglycohydrolase